MKALALIAVVLLSMVFLGCISSINPLFTKDELIFNADLLGNWRDGDSQLSFTSNDENEYTLISSDGGEVQNFKAHLLRLGNNTFLDISPIDTLHDNYLFYATHFPVHYFFRIKMEQEQIILSELNNELLSDLVNDNRENISIVKSQEDRMLLTASTKELQDLVQKYEELFSNPVVFRKEN